MIIICFVNWLLFLSLSFFYFFATNKPTPTAIGCIIRH